MFLVTAYGILFKENYIMEDMYILFGEYRYESSTIMGLYTKMEKAIEYCREYRRFLKGKGDFHGYYIVKVTPDQPYDPYKLENVVARFDPEKSGKGWQYI